MKFTPWAIKDRQLINNEVYDQIDWRDPALGAFALLRKESEFKARWVLEVCERQALNFSGDQRPASKGLISQPLKILDLACGAGFVTEALAEARLGELTGVDLSENSLRQARANAEQKGLQINYLQRDAYDLGFSDQFDAITCFDFLEHVSEPKKVLEQAFLALKPGGLFFFHTFNRTWLANLVIIKGMEWFVRGTPKKLHVYELFIPPRDLAELLIDLGFSTPEMVGIRPRVNLAFFKLLLTGVVSEKFAFTQTSSLKLGYLGFARKPE
jgi:2-polyprenyl-6-hydroxyphenyl methylase/3-demethylubiquinone-9 3-methyltransferase